MCLLKRNATALVVAVLVVATVVFFQTSSLGEDRRLFADTAFAATCSPRTPVRIQVTQSQGRLQVTVTAGADSLQELRFGAGTNALVDIGTLVGSPGSVTVPLPSRPATVAFSVRQAASGAVTVPFVAVDGCGDWPTFVGAGATSLGVIPPPITVATPTVTAMPTATSTPSKTPTPTATPTSGGSLTLQDLDGHAFLLSADSTFIGNVSSNQFAADSICNSFGTYGSKFSSKSVRNTFGTYGSPFSSKSAYNQFAGSPPAIIYGGTIVGYLTKNTTFSSRVDPDVLFAAYGCTQQ